MRVIAGEKGGRRIVAPEGRRTRPTAERVREAAFSMLESYLGAAGGGLAGAVVWDLFAGSGALGIEALSRGAAHASFVDSARPAVSAVHAGVYCADVLRWAYGLAGQAGGGSTKADLVLADPPYGWDAWRALLQALRPLRPLVVIESAHPVELPEGWVALRQRGYGGSLVTLTSCEVGASLGER